LEYTEILLTECTPLILQFLLGARVQVTLQSYRAALRKHAIQQLFRGLKFLFVAKSCEPVPPKKIGDNEEIIPQCSTRDALRLFSNIG
jgi:hypothetical protein